MDFFFLVSAMIFTAGMAVEDIIKMWLSSSQLRIQWTQIGL